MLKIPYTIEDKSYSVFNLEYLSHHLFILTCLLPSIIPIISFSDTQPVYFFFAIAIIILDRFKTNPNLGSFILLLGGVFSLILSLNTDLSSSIIRRIYSYFSVFFVVWATMILIKKNFLNLSSLIKTIIAFLFIVTLIQNFIDKDFLTFLLSRSSSAWGRGTVGLFNEPSALAAALVFYLILQFILDKKFDYISLFLVSIIIIFLAKSSLGLLFLLLLLGSNILFNPRNSIIILSSIFALFITLYLLTGSDSRMGRLLDLLYTQPEIILLIDQSVHDRFFAIFFSLKGFYENYFFPNGFGAYSQAVETFVPYSEIANNSWISKGITIMSGYGAALFELGIIGIIYIIYPLILIFNYFKKNFGAGLSLSVSLTAFMFASIPISYPMYGLMIGILLSKVKK